ncbi:TPA: hypothetical protein ACFITR_000292 [Neisseria gonorrhoeae]
MAGVTVGRGSVVGAGAVITKDIPPYSLAAGNPAVVKKNLPEGSMPPERVGADDLKKQEHRFCFLRFRRHRYCASAVSISW